MRFITYKQVYDFPAVERAKGKISVSSYEKQNQVRLGALLVTASSEIPDDVNLLSL